MRYINILSQTDVENIAKQQIKKFMKARIKFLEDEVSRLRIKITDMEKIK